VCTYPIAFHGLRDGALGLAGIANPSKRTKLSLTFALVGVVTAAAIALTDLGVVAAISGALFASLIGA
jgi:sodium-coupled neutral amino acid transporter 11